MASAFALAIIQGNSFLCRNTGASADAPVFHFHRWVVAENGIRSAAFCESAALRVSVLNFLY